MTSPEKLATPEINHASAETAKVVEHAIGALADILGGWRYIRQSHGDLYGVGWDRCEKSASIAIAALRTEVEALATQRQGKGDGWQPIETAPKDGTEIILSNGKDVSAGSWFGGDEGTCDRDGAPNCDERDAGWLDWSGGMLPEPTHFMPIPAAPGATSQGVAVAQPDKLREAVILAYGHLWHVNNEPAAPIPMRSPEKAAYEARKVLRDLLTSEERGDGINKVGQLIGRYDAATTSKD